MLIVKKIKLNVLQFFVVPLHTVTAMTKKILPIAEYMDMTK